MTERMRLFNQLALVLVCIYVAGVIAGDPCTDGSYTEGTLFPYDECSEYYNECVHGKTLKRPCAPGTVFDKNVGVCNHPNNVAACGETDGCNGHAHGELYVPDGGCYTYFYQCSHGTEYKFNCPSDLVFDESLDVCNWPSDVTGCGAEGNGCNGHANGALYVDDEDGCYNFFYQCNWGTPIKKSCGPGTVFNPSISVCDHPYNVPACSNNGGCHGHTHGDLYTLDDNCSPYFYQCVHEKEYKMPCPDGLVFDTDSLVCDWPNDVQGCGGDSSIESTTTSTSRPTEVHSTKQSTVATEPKESDGCNGHNNGELYVPEDGCYPYFYQCSHGTEYKIDCPSGLIFDESIDVCNWPSDVAGCGAESDGCNGHANGAHYVDDEDGCYDFFYQCNWGTPVKKSCGPGTVFNPSISVCDHPYNVPACSNDDGCHGHNHGDLYILDNTCSPFFYQCVHGKEYQMPCPDGLVFDTDILVCNWPNDVEGCKGDSSVETTTRTSKSTTKATTTTQAKSTSPETSTTTIPNSTTARTTTPKSTTMEATSTVKSTTVAKTTTSKTTVKSTEMPTTHTTHAIESKEKTYVGFVIDDTGSMKNEIIAVKQWLTECIEGTRFLCGNAPTGGWVVSTFNDPDSGFITGPTTNASHIIHTINSLEPHGGWDCPEMALSGVQAALNAIPTNNDGCKIFFFSDAVAKDRYKAHATFKLAIKKNYSDRAETIYYQLAEQTGGDIFILPKPKSSKVMTTVLKNSATLGLCGTTIVAGPSGNEYLCEADCIAKKMCWDRSVSKCYCPSANNCAIDLIEEDKSRCHAARGNLLCNPNVVQDYFADVASCSSFFTCSWGKATHHQCDEGKIFTPMRDDHCDVPQNVPGPCGNGRPFPEIVL